MPYVSDFIHRASKLDVINLRSKFKFNNAHYPNVEVI
jgi:hypothetical protein